MRSHVLNQQVIVVEVKSEAADIVAQYSLGKILAIWALAALPMALLAWVVAPAAIRSSPLHPGIVYWLLMIAGMAWQAVVGLTILYRELGTLRWSAVRARTWLQTPRDPESGRPERKLFWWLVPALLFSALINMALAGYMDAPMARLLPGLQPAAYQDNAQLVSPEFQGTWWLFGVLLASQFFNYFLGEELLFRGVLLPKMQGAFGRYDWVANAALFGLYHLHKPWMLPSLIVGSLAITWPARRFRSNWMAIVVHGVEGLPALVLVPAVILGLMG